MTAWTCVCVGGWLLTATGGPSDISTLRSDAWTSTVRMIAIGYGAARSSALLSTRGVHRLTMEE
jgi:hypothetical protein